VNCTHLRRRDLRRVCLRRSRRLAGDLAVKGQELESPRLHSCGDVDP